MAESILRLRLESGEYEAKLRQAVTGLQKMESECRAVAGVMDVMAGETQTDVDANMEFLKSIGQMETAAKDAAGQVSELSKAYKDLSAVYARMDNGEKQSEVGRALAEQLNQLRDRASAAREEYNRLGADLGENGVGGVISKLTGIVGLNLKNLSLLGAAMTALSTVVKVTKDAFQSNRLVMVDFNRSIDESKNLYQGFLVALNTGDISGYLQTMDRIAKAASDAFNAVADLNKLKILDIPALAGIGSEIQRMQAMLRTGRAIAPQGDGKNYGETGTMLTQEQKEDVSQNLQVLLARQVEITQTELTKTDNAISALYEKQASVLQISKEEFLKGVSSYEEFQRMIEGARNYEAFEKQVRKEAFGANMRYQAGSNNTYQRPENPYQEFAGWGNFDLNSDVYKQIISLIQEREQKKQAMYAATSMSYRQINRVDGYKPYVNSSEQSEKEVTIQQQIIQLETEYLTATEERRTAIRETIQDLQRQLAIEQELRKEARGEVDEGDADRSTFNTENLDYAIGSLKQMLDQSDIGSELYNALTSQLRDATALQQALQAAIKNGIDPSQLGLDDFWQQIFGDGGPGDWVADQDWQALADKINEELKNLGLDPIELKFDVKTGTFMKAKESVSDVDEEMKKTAKSTQMAGNAIGQMGSAIGAIETPVANVVGTVMQAVANVAVAASSAMTAAATKPESSGWAWLAFAASATATMISTIAAIHKATGYAQGGEVRGTSYSGDNIGALVDGQQLVGLNAGEIVLTRAMTGNLASQLQEGGGQSGGTYKLYTNAESIVTVLNAWGLRTGRGKIIR